MYLICGLKERGLKNYSQILDSMALRYYSDMTINGKSHESKYSPGWITKQRFSQMLQVLQARCFTGEFYKLGGITDCYKTVCVSLTQ